MHQRAALDAGEDLAVEALAAGRVGKDHAAAGAAQGLVRGGGGDVGVRDGALVQTGGHQARDVGHVHHEDGTHLIGDGPETGEVDLAGIGAGAGHDGGGLVLAGDAGHFVIVDAAGLAAHAVEDVAEQLARKVDGAAVGQMAAVGQIHAQDGVAGLEEGEIGAHVGLGTGVGLHVDVFAAEELPGAFDGQVLDHVDIFAAAVIALARIAFGILVGQHAALGFPHGRRNEVFRSDQFQFGDLALGFQGDGTGQFRVLKQDFVHSTALPLG